MEHANRKTSVKEPTTNRSQRKEGPTGERNGKRSGKKAQAVTMSNNARPGGPDAGTNETLYSGIPIRNPPSRAQCGRGWNSQHGTRKGGTNEKRKNGNGKREKLKHNDWGKEPPRGEGVMKEGEWVDE